MAWPGSWTDDEFESSQKELDKFLDEHLGPAPAIGDRLDAEYVMMPLWLPSAGLGAMNAQREREKLAKLRQLVNEFSKLWYSLHSDVRGEMELLGAAIEDANLPEHAMKLYLSRIHRLVGLIDEILPSARKVIDTAPRAGRRNLVNAGIARHLQAVWFERTGTHAPNSMTEAGCFAEFMIGAFNALRLPGNPRAALDSWRAFRATLPERE
ncbi:hypothetical protein [Chelativorans sp. M5D2P16]|uniref:hypothetical protein n=1 Tax=Chelativorans sp. M5D2P16 TaxID=3095678 RepID=UPI002ACAD39A|nr:hypothetical protein [Chelativorans sp. M5D2P16]MDZ5697630.1 hypothetical protein [Chelativorans sp. M5D2P16]